MYVRVFVPVKTDVKILSCHFGATPMRTQKFALESSNFDLSKLRRLRFELSTYMYGAGYKCFWHLTFLCGSGRISDALDTFWCISVHPSIHPCIISGSKAHKNNASTLCVRQNWQFSVRFWMQYFIVSHHKPLLLSRDYLSYFSCEVSGQRHLSCRTKK